MKLHKIAIFALSIIFLALPAHGETMALTQPNIQVRGEATIDVTPDYARINLSLSQRDRDVKKAMTQSEAAVAQIIGDLKEAFDVEEKDIQTDMVRAYPVYVNCRDTERLKQLGILPNNCETSIIDYYQVQRNITVQYRDLAALPALLSSILERSLENETAINIGGLQLKSSLEEEYKTMARVEAAKNARSKAAKIAETLGSDIGDVLQINVDNVSVPVISLPFKTAGNMAPQAMMMRAESFGGGGHSPSNSIAPGTIEIRASNSVIFALK